MKKPPPLPPRQFSDLRCVSRQLSRLSVDDWIDEKGRRIYEWDSQHGELEIYLASDGSHIGAFNHITGEQLKNPMKKRNIKKYL